MFPVSVTKCIDVNVEGGLDLRTRGLLIHVDGQRYSPTSRFYTKCCSDVKIFDGREPFKYPNPQVDMSLIDDPFGILLCFG